MLEWKDVLQVVGTTLGNHASDCILEFLRVLPEEVTEGRKINLSVRGVKTPLAFGQAFGALSTVQWSLIIITTIRKMTLFPGQRSFWRTMQLRCYIY